MSDPSGMIARSDPEGIETLRQRDVISEIAPSWSTNSDTLYRLNRTRQRRRQVSWWQRARHRCPPKLLVSGAQQEKLRTSAPSC